MEKEKKKTGKTGKRRSNGQLARDRRMIARYYLKGVLQMDIAERLDLSPSTVSNDIKILQTGWLKQTKKDYAEAKGLELAKIDNLEIEYWKAWKRSTKDKQVATKKAVAADKSNRKEAMERSEGQYGDPRFLNGIQWCINKRCQILGLDAPTEIIIPGAKAYIGISPDDWDEQESDDSDGDNEQDTDKKV